MSSEKQKLTVREVQDAGLVDWRQLRGTLRARFSTGDFATGLGLVDHIGAVAEEANHHPDITLTYPEVRVTLSSHDVGGITSRDVDLARRISDYAAQRNIESAPTAQSEAELGLDTEAPERLGPFYAALLDTESRDGEVVDPSGQAPTIWFQGSDEGGPGLPSEDHQQRWHLDVWVPMDEALGRVQAAVDAGGTLVSDAAAPSYWVLADPEGNRSCICSVSGR